MIDFERIKSLQQNTSEYENPLVHTTKSVSFVVNEPSEKFVFVWLLVLPSNDCLQLRALGDSVRIFRVLDSDLRNDPTFP